MPSSIAPMHDMIKWSSNMATNYIIDLVTLTTGDTLLEGRELQEWVEKRGFANRWIRSFGWPEMASINVAQKNMDDDRYGRERQLVDALGHNSLTTNATARLFHEIFAGRDLLRARAVRQCSNCWRGRSMRLGCRPSRMPRSPVISAPTAGRCQALVEGRLDRLDRRHARQLPPP